MSSWCGVKQAPSLGQQTSSMWTPEGGLLTVTLQDSEPTAAHHTSSPTCAQPLCSSHTSSNLTHLWRAMLVFNCGVLGLCLTFTHRSNYDRLQSCKGGFFLFLCPRNPRPWILCFLYFKKTQPLKDAQICFGRERKSVCVYKLLLLLAHSA